jgi:hypothetical protein
LKFPFEQVMLIRRLNLSLADSSDSGVLRSADRAFGILIDLVQTPPVERMLAEEMNRREI